jgi:hypothetical protein
MIRENNKEKWFSVTALLYSIIILLWILLTPSLSTEGLILGYTSQRITMMGFILIFILFFIFLLLFHNKKKNILFQTIFHSTDVLIISFLALLISFILCLTGLFLSYQVNTIIFQRILPINTLIFLFLLEIIIFQIIASTNESALPASEIKIRQITKERKISLLVLIIVMGFSIAVFYHYIQGAYIENIYPKNTFLYMASDRFNDFFNPMKGTYDLDPYRPDRIEMVGGYFPFGYLVTYLFSILRPWDISCLLLILVFVVFLWNFNKRSLFGKQKIQSSQILAIFVLTFLTYPVLFAIDRGNFDMLVFIFIALFVYFYQKGNKTVATLLLAFPIAMKGYPVFLLTIPLLDRRFKDFGLAVILTGALEIFSLSVFKGGLIVEFGKMITSFISAYSIAFVGGSVLKFNNSLFTFLLFINPSLIATSWFGQVYFYASIFIYVLLCIVMYKKQFPFWKVLFIVSLMMILLPQSSGDYRLILLIPALLTFVSKENSSRWELLAVILSGLILIPKAYLWFYNSAHELTETNIGIFITPILLFILVVTLFFLPQIEL